MLIQAIRIVRALLPVLSLMAAACANDDIEWSDPLTLSGSDADSRLAVDAKGRVRLVPDTSVSVVPTTDSRVCVSSVRVARQDDGSLAAAWWSVRDDSSAMLLASVSPDGGHTWQPQIRVDTADVASVGCNRPAPAIVGSAGFLHVVYAMHASEGVGVFYAHSMTAGRSYEPAVTILYGDRLTAAAIAADKGTVAVAYEDPNGTTPQIGLAISLDWGHIFRERVRGSTGVGEATNPEVAVAGREVAVSWVVGSIGGDSDGRASRLVRVGRLP